MRRPLFLFRREPSSSSSLYWQKPPTPSPSLTTTCSLSFLSAVLPRRTLASPFLLFRVAPFSLLLFFHLCVCERVLPRAFTDRRHRHDRSRAHLSGGIEPSYPPLPHRLLHGTRDAKNCSDSSPPPRLLPGLRRTLPPLTNSLRRQPCDE
jgi:hypothetical protein